MSGSPELLRRGLFAFFALFLITSTFSIALSQNFLGLSVVVFIVVAIRERYNPFAGPARVVYLVILAYLAWLVISSLAGPTPLRSIAMCREEWLFFAIPVGIYLCRDENWRDALITCWAYAVGILSLYALVEFATGMNYIAWDGGFVPEPTTRPIGNFSNWLTFAEYFAMAGAFLFAAALFPKPIGRARRWLYLGAGVTAFVAVMLNASRTPILAIFFALFFIAMVKGGRLRWVVVGLMVALAAVALSLPQVREKFSENLGRDTSEQYAGSRRYIWSHTLPIVKAHPLVGVGPGNFYDAYAAQLPADISPERKHSHAHNDFLNFAAEIGIPGALIFAALWIAALRMIGRAAFTIRLGPEERRAAFAALVGSVVFLVTSLTESTFADEEVRQALMFVWAVGLAIAGAVSEKATTQKA